MENNNHLIYNPNTGEIVGELNPEEHYLRSRKQDAFVKNNEKAKAAFEEFNAESGKFIWSYPEKIMFLINSPEFTKADLTMIFYLATYVNGTGYLSFDNGIKLSKASIRERLGISRNAYSKFFNKLINHQILIPSADAYKWNEKFNFYGKTKGKAKPKMLVRTYIRQIRELYEAVTEKGKRKYSAIALYPIFALVPYLHHSSNIICKNPEVNHVEDIDYYTLSEIATLLDLTNSKKMSQSLSSILLNGQTAFIKVESKNEKYLKLNPRIFWNGTSAPDRNLLAEFDMINKNRDKGNI
ncbi:hypothetical protein ACIQ2D_11270 [Lysinibacillus sp. NPDC097287]|uniref:hypothetical protein n=1 Tax=Lysinibacillus sp. NPDC097287 TaxID=3364144 RepID=UPI003804BF9B